MTKKNSGGSFGYDVGGGDRASFWGGDKNPVKQCTRCGPAHNKWTILETLLVAIFFLKH